MGSSRLIQTLASIESPLCFHPSMSAAAAASSSPARLNHRMSRFGTRAVQGVEVAWGDRPCRKKPDARIACVLLVTRRVTAKKPVGHAHVQMHMTVESRPEAQDAAAEVRAKFLLDMHRDRVFAEASLGEPDFEMPGADSVKRCLLGVAAGVPLGHPVRRAWLCRMERRCRLVADRDHGRAR